MAAISPFHSRSAEASKARANRVYHNNSACEIGRGVAGRDRTPSTGGHQLCDDCVRLNKQEAALRA